MFQYNLGYPGSNGITGIDGDSGISGLMGIPGLKVSVYNYWKVHILNWIYN